jgi:hypothetical protein
VNVTQGRGWIECEALIAKHQILNKHE